MHKPAASTKTGVKKLAIFGDSYSAPNRSSLTWPHHLARTHPDIAIANYAVPGATAEDDLGAQVSAFLSSKQDKTQDTVYVIFIGINDVGFSSDEEYEEALESITDAAHALYTKARARRFVFADVPPMGRAPGAFADRSSLTTRVASWNTLLCSVLATWATEYAHADVIVWRVHAAVDKFLDKPATYIHTRHKEGLDEDSETRSSDTSADSDSNDEEEDDSVGSDCLTRQVRHFTEADVAHAGGTIWQDDVHLTSDVHRVVLAQSFAEEVLARWSEVPK
ncbi:SGNH hydrolase-type esterase domain-containing protein [Amylostereum chailletii]|nr:SGNH hydrolase-type esterase domain-containing protein [Amylostereum chailletii]